MLFSTWIEEISSPFPTRVVFLWLQLRTKKKRKTPRKLRKVCLSKEQLQCKEVNEGFGEGKSMRVFIAWINSKE